MAVYADAMGFLRSRKIALNLTSSSGRMLFVPSALLAVLVLVTTPTATKACTHFYGYTPPTSGNLVSNFLLPFSPTSPNDFEIPLGSSAGQGLSGDGNATYFSLYYSITNMTAWATANGYCPVELLIVGTFPNARYVSIAVNDMHYALSQHLADADIDPLGSGPGMGNSYTNPFAPGIEYNGSQLYLAPVSLGYVPGNGSLSGCAITPFEEDNLLDATQRHLSNDWNTYAVENMLVPGKHKVDTPGHSIPNLAGSILVRNYLSAQTCTATSANATGVTCQPNPAFQNPYLMVRDAATGCPIKASVLTSNNLVYTGGSLPCGTRLAPQGATRSCRRLQTCLRGHLMPQVTG